MTKVKKFDADYYRSKMLAAHNALHELRFEVTRQIHDKWVKDEIIRLWDQYIRDAQNVDKQFGIDE